MKLIQHVLINPSWPEYGYRADGTKIRLADVETVLPAGEQRDGVFFVHEKGHRVWPWKEAGYYVDDDGEVLAPVFDVVPMPRAELVQLGLDDATLWTEYQAYFEAARRSPLEGLDTAKVQVARRKMYDAVTGAWYSDRPRRDR